MRSPIASTFCPREGEQPLEIDIGSDPSDSEATPYNPPRRREETPEDEDGDGDGDGDDTLVIRDFADILAATATPSP